MCSSRVLHTTKQLATLVNSCRGFSNELYEPWSSIQVRHISKELFVFQPTVCHLVDFMTFFFLGNLVLGNLLFKKSRTVVVVTRANHCDDVIIALSTDVHVNTVRLDRKDAIFGYF